VYLSKHLGVILPGQFHILAFVRFEVLTAVALKVTIFRDVTSCSLVHFTDVSEERTSYIFRVEE
jgi:hypothetical protein